jgi:hypothetical protein
MKRRDFLKLTSAASVVTLVSPAGIFQSYTPSGTANIAGLKAGFLSPPDSARTHTFWFWMNGNITKAGITSDLEAIKAAGVGGVLNFDAGTGMIKGSVDFGSREYWDLKNHAISECNRLNLFFGMHNCPGWSSSGGPWVTPENSMLEVTWSETAVKGGITIKTNLSKPNNKDNFYRDIHVLAYQALSGEQRIKDWKSKANYTGGGDNALPTPPVSKESVIDPDSIIDLTSRMDAEGNLVWDVPEGNWTILRLGYTTKGTLNRAAPEGGEGLEIDKFSKEAMDMHFNAMMSELLSSMAPLAEKGKIYLEIDSWEVGIQNWTPLFPEEFQKHTGYDLLKYLPAMTGRIVGSPEISDRFLWDLRRTQADLVADNYYGRFNELCKKYNLSSYNEPYNPGPFEEIQISSRVDTSMAEFWNGLSSWFPWNYEHRRTTKLCASVAHTYGRKIVGAEAFTAEAPSGKWQEYPFAMKGLGDRYFTEGLTRVVFHRYAQQPHPDSKVAPGMTMSYWGMHFERTNTWWEQSRKWLDYLARCQYMLQQGLFVADLAYFTGEGAPNETKVFRENLNPLPPEGFDYDLVNREVILNRMEVKDGRIVLPDGMSYRILFLQDQETMSLELIQKLYTLVNQGMVLVGSKPLRAPGLGIRSGNDQTMQSLANELWGNLDGKTITERNVGKGKVFWGAPIECVLNKLNVVRDFECSSHSGDAPVRYIHRTIDGMEAYFVCNDRREYEDLICTFRVDGKQPELWDAETGKVISSVIFENENGLTRIPFQLNPYGSVFVVFRPPFFDRHLKSIRKDNITVLGTTPLPKSEQIKFGEVINDFSICLWVKPEIDIMANTTSSWTSYRQWTDFYAIYPPSGKELYGEGHEACGLAVGRNGVAIWHRHEHWPYMRMASKTPIEGWSHIALVYENGIPSVYINGTHSKGELFENKNTNHTVHPGIGKAYLQDGASYYNGDMSQPQLFPEVLSETRIKQLIQEGISSPKMNRILPSVQSVGAKIPELLFWQNGNYDMEDDKGKVSKIEVSGINQPVELSGSWEVEFPADLGAPERISLPELKSLHQHELSGVKYFSGTASYTKQFQVNSDSLSAGKRLYLDLGRVEVSAEVIVNGKSLGVLWSRPYQVEITDAVIIGMNELSVKVVNLWPNRLIGDEQLPPEYEFEKPDGDKGACIKKMPEWYLKGEPKPKGERITFCTWQHFQKNDPLLESGLIGPVRILEAMKTLFNHPKNSIQ